MTLLIGTSASLGSDQQGHSLGWKLLSRLDTHIRSYNNILTLQIDTTLYAFNALTQHTDIIDIFTHRLTPYANTLH